MKTRDPNFSQFHPKKYNFSKNRWISQIPDFSSKDDEVSNLGINSPEVETLLRRQRSGFSELQAISLHDTRTVNLTPCSVSVIPANKLPLPEVYQIIGIKLLTSGFPETFGSSSQFPGWANTCFSPCGRP